MRISLASACAAAVPTDCFASSQHILTAEVGLFATLPYRIPRILYA